MWKLSAEDRFGISAFCAIAAVAGLLIFWNLAEKDLWQDEAATAILGWRMLEFGKPLAYDGKNLLTIDMVYSDEHALERQDGDPQTALAFHRRLREMKPDTAWKWHPWGLFAIAAAGLKLMGQTTLAARLPFALAGLATVALLFLLARKHFGATVAVFAALFLVFNPYWILHARQCRYYSVSSLCLVLTVMAYMRWQRNERLGAIAFIAAAWCWFQVDFGTVWPVLGVLFLDALIYRTQPLRKILTVGTALGLVILPFLYYYELWGRGSMRRGLRWRFLDNAFNLNEYVLPVSILLAFAVVLAFRWKSRASLELRLAAIAAGSIVALAFWIPLIADVYLRYAIIAVPAAALVTAWLMVQLIGKDLVRLFAAAAILIVTPWASLPLHALLSPPDWYPATAREVEAPARFWVRKELSFLNADIFSHQPDPNRMVIEWLRQNAAPTDEILVNYEDLPLVFYLPNPVRGGMTAFRAEDDARTPPRFVILRHSVDFVNWPIYLREVQRYQWAPIQLNAPDVPWGNNPDPMGQVDDPKKEPPLYFARRIGP